MMRHALVSHCKRRACRPTFSPRPAKIGVKNKWKINFSNKIKITLLAARVAALPNKKYNNFSFYST